MGSVRGRRPRPAGTPAHGSPLQRRAWLALALASLVSLLPAVVEAERIDLSGLGKTVAWRLRMELAMESTSDSHEGGSNTEDEIYYELAGFKVIGGRVTRFDAKSLRPDNPSKDVWEMGYQSNDHLTRLLFASKMKLLDAAGLLLAIHEQDPVGESQFSDRKEKNRDAVNALMDALGGDGFLLDETGDDRATLDSVVDDMDRLLRLAPWHQALGLVQVKVRGGQLEVKPVGESASIVSQPDGRTVEVEVSGFRARYRLTLVLEKDDTSRPKTRVFLDRSEDACGADNLWVESKNGDILIKKGDPDTDVYIKDDRYSWHCGSHDSDDSSNAPDATNVAVTRRAATGGKITWTWYSERTLKPDLK